MGLFFGSEVMDVGGFLNATGAQALPIASPLAPRYS